MEIYDNEITVVMTKEFFEQHKVKAAKLYAEDGFEGEGYTFHFNTATQDFDIQKNTLTQSFADAKNNWFSMSWKVDRDMYAYLAEICIKKLNKFRALIESAS